jgi:hypothetical protein
MNRAKHKKDGNLPRPFFVSRSLASDLTSLLPSLLLIANQHASRWQIFARHQDHATAARAAFLFQARYLPFAAPELLQKAAQRALLDRGSPRAGP